MNEKDKKFIRSVLTQVVYGFTEDFLSDVLSDSQDETKIKKEHIMREASTYIEKNVDNIIQQFEENGINSVKDIEEKPQIVTELVTKIEEGMKENAKKLSE